MCNPAMVAAAALQAGGSIYKGISARDAAWNAEKMTLGNVDLLTKQADIEEGKVDLATIRGNYDEFLTRRTGSRVLAAETAHYASGNVDPTYGSPLAQQAYSASQIETDAQLIRARMMSDRADALTTVANTRARALDQANRAVALHKQGSAAFTSGMIGAATSFLSAGAKWPGLSGSSSGSTFSGDLTSNPFWTSQPEDI